MILGGLGNFKHTEALKLPRCNVNTIYREVGGDANHNLSLRWISKKTVDTFWITSQGNYSKYYDIFKLLLCQKILNPHKKVQSFKNTIQPVQSREELQLYNSFCLHHKTRAPSSLFHLRRALCYNNKRLFLQNIDLSPFNRSKNFPIRTFSGNK